MATKKRGQAPQEAPSISTTNPLTEISTIPVKGAAWENEDPALTILAERMTQMESAIGLMAQNVSAMVATTDKQMKAYHQELMEEKDRSAQALDAAQQALQKLQEEKPIDPKTLADIVKVETKAANRKLEKKRAKFREHLNTCPLGEIFNPTEEVIRLGVNGVFVILQPMTTSTVPEPFVLHWEHHQAQSKWAKKQDHLIRVKDGMPMGFGELEQWRARNSEGAIRNIGGDFSPKEITIWSET